MTFEEWIEKYKPINNWLHKGGDTELFETYGVELGVVLGVNLMDTRKVWTLIEGDEGLWVTNGYHLVNRLNYFITDIPYEGEEEFMDVLYMEYGDEENDEEELEWIEKTSRLASATSEEEIEAIIAK